MDVAGAKALKERLGQNSVDETQSAPTQVPEGAPPLYHWFGVSSGGTQARAQDADNEAGGSLLRRLGLSFR
jgi:hypothetical protein